MKFYIVVLKHGSATKERPVNYRVYFGLCRNLVRAKQKASKAFNGYKIIAWREL